MIKVTRQDLIKICDDFLNGKINKIDVENYGAEIIFDVEDKYECEDEIVDEIIFHWDNEIINYKINETNIKLWKNWLLTGKNELPEYNIWNIHIEPQKTTCEKYNSNWKPINKKLNIGISANSDLEPIHGIRYSQEKGTTGWFIWFGEYSEDPSFFKPMCAEHLLQIAPNIIKYLGLEVGYRFLIDGKGYEDVWKDENIK